MDPCGLWQCFFKPFWKGNADLLQTACVINDTTGTFTWNAVNVIKYCSSTYCTSMKCIRIILVENFLPIKLKKRVYKQSCQFSLKIEIMNFTCSGAIVFLTDVWKEESPEIKSK